MVSFIPFRRLKVKLRYRTFLIPLMLITVLVVALFLAVSQPSVPAETDTEPPFYVGVEIGWKANATECKAVIDEVKINENNIAMNERHVDLQSGSSYNTLYHNNFVNNTEQKIDNTDDVSYQPGTLYDWLASWDNGSEGNYWSDYTTKFPNAIELDNLGVWNNPYPIQTPPYGALPNPQFSISVELPLIASVLF